MMPLAERIQSDAFAGYAYAYPHKTSYRTLDPPVRLADAWCDEDRNNLFLYVHLPFCEMRCGFCNLFTTIQPPDQLVEDTLTAIERQSVAVVDEVRPQRISQLAFGGGTPSYLNLEELRRLFRHLSNKWPIPWHAIPVSFEVSPATVDEAKLQFLRTTGIDRISMGIQSFSEGDLKQLGRPQSADQVTAAVQMIQSCQFPIFNVDLIYGSAGQSSESWKATVDQTIQILPEEIYLYPLYVRELTGLGRTGKSASDRRRELFLIARERLLDAGYRACSMRLFRRTDVSRATDHCCQDDGMIGLGPGARSYTRDLHYSSEYAVGQGGVKRIIADFNLRTSDDFAFADYGVTLDRFEQRRRYLIKSLLQSTGLRYGDYELRFGTDVWADFPELHELSELEFRDEDSTDTLRLNCEGMSWSDVIGPWLYSAQVTSRMEACELT